jgi:predicted transcriptional regulator
MEPLEVYNNTYKQIQSIFSSRLKIQILLSAAGGPKNLSELRDVTGSSSQAIIPKIRSLERMSLLEPCDHGYGITPLGRVLVTKIGDLVVTMGELMQHREFWATHDIEGIPQPFLSQVGDLISSDVKFDTTDNMFHVYTHFVSILQQAGYIHGISSFMNPQIADVLSERIVAGVPVELVVSRSIADGLMQEPFLGKIQQLRSYNNFKIWVVDEPLYLGITVTDKNLSLGLNKKVNAVYDSSADMHSNDPRARGWAERLFQYYRGRAVLLKLG